jgi:hypothetical protein
MEMSGKIYTPATLPTGKDQNNHGMGGWVSPRADFTFQYREKYIAPAGMQTPDRPARSLVPILTTLPRILIRTVEWRYSSTHS